MFELSDNAYQQYKNSVKDRCNITKEQAELILNRNIILSDRFDNKHHIRFYYGKLCIFIHKETKIITGVKNNTRHNKSPDKLKKNLLNQMLGIGE